MFCVSLDSKLFVVATSLANWDYQKLLTGYLPAEAWTGDHFYISWAVSFVIIDSIVALALYALSHYLFPLQTTVLYFIIDLAWVSCSPLCVKSPDIIVKVSDCQSLAFTFVGIVQWVLCLFQ
jgi:hypothetical protein